MGKSHPPHRGKANHRQEQDGQLGKPRRLHRWDVPTEKRFAFMLKWHFSELSCRSPIRIAEAICLAKPFYTHTPSARASGPLCEDGFAMSVVRCK